MMMLLTLMTMMIFASLSQLSAVSVAQSIAHSSATQDKPSEVSLCQKATLQCNDSTKIEWHVNYDKSPDIPTQSGHA